MNGNETGPPNGVGERDRHEKYEHNGQNEPDPLPIRTV
jgi:hypothetical protein